MTHNYRDTRKVNEAQPPRLSKPNASFATVIVGSEQQRFVVHESLLTHYSRFFRAAFTGGFKEASDKTLPLKDQSPRIFELFVHWLYYQRFPDADWDDDHSIIELFRDEDLPDEDRLPELYNSTDTLIKLYVFADRCDVGNLMRAVLDELYRRIVKSIEGVYMSAASVNYAFEHLSTTSPLCRFLVDVVCFMDGCLHSKPIDPQSITSLPFLRMVWQSYKESGGVNPVSPLDNLFDPELCNYHEHRDWDEKDACWKRRRDSVLGSRGHTSQCEELSTKRHDRA